MMDYKKALEKLDDKVFKMVEKHPRIFILCMLVLAIFLSTALIDIILFAFKFLGWLFKIV